MKSKPPAKKAKLEVQSSSTSSPQSTEGQGKPKAKILNAAIKEGTSSKAAAAAASTASEPASSSKIKTAAAGAGSNSAVTTAGTTSPLRLSFPFLPSPDLAKDFPRIANMAQHVKMEAGNGSITTAPFSLPIDEVELIQHELETLWSLLAVRTRVIRNENEILETLLAGNADMSSATVASLLGDHYDPHHQEKINTVKSIIDSGHGTRTSVTAAAKLVMGLEQTKGVTPTSSTSSSIVVGSNRKSNNSAAAATSVPIPGPSPSARQPKKKLKAELGDKSKVGGNKPARAGQNRSHSVSMDDSFLRHEAPNQFWEFADSYCRDITQEDIDALDQEIADFREIPDSAFSVPPLGKHYSGLDRKKTGDLNGANEEKDKDAVGPLTQRLVTALVEDRISQYTVQTSNGNREELNGGGGESHLIPRPGLVKALGLDAAGPGAQISLEARLKMVLTDQGYLLGDEAEDPFSTDQDDEVSAEIKRTLNTLRKLHSHNLDKLEKLAVSAKGELARLPQKKDLEKADKDIIAAYRGITACRIKRKPITQKERSVATKALQYRQHALEKLTGTNSSAVNSDDQC